MSDVSSTSATYTTQDMTLESCKEYLDAEVNLADLIEMTSDQLAAYFEKLYNESEISDDDIEAFEIALQAELDEFYAGAEERKNLLTAMYESGNLSPGEMTNIADLITQQDTYLSYCDEIIMDALDEGIAESTEKHIEIEDGETYTFDAESPQNGDVYYVDMTSDSGTEDGSTSGNNTEANADWLDQDGDGYKETDPDANNDGIADDDFDGDLDIDEDDLTAGATESVTTFELNGDSSDPKIEETYFADYNEDTHELTLKVTYEDGTINYIKITLPADLDGVKLAISPIPENYESIPDDISAILYEKTNSEFSNYYFVHGSEPNASGNYYSIYDMTDYPSPNLLSIAPETTDFSETRTYTVNCSAAADTINLDFDDSTTVTMEATYDYTNHEYDIVITATDANGKTVTIILNDVSMYDTINITGGTVDTTSEVFDKKYWEATAGEDTYGVYLGDVFTVDGTRVSGTSTEDLGTNQDLGEEYWAMNGNGSMTYPNGETVSYVTVAAE